MVAEDAERARNVGLDMLAQGRGATYEVWPLDQVVAGELVRTGFSVGPGRAHLGTVHPLGGAAIAGGPDEGVVDHFGRVFGQSGLFVVDGAILPDAPGVPPSMTIAALAERIAALA